jgi:RHS repeat-associated protein
VLNDGKYEYRYDDERNLTQKKELLTRNLTTYEWDYRNRLMKVVSGSQTVEYGYDAEDKRVSKKLNGVTTEKYVYDGADIALVLNATGTLVERYLYGDGTDHVLSRERSGTVVWSLGDRQGSVVDLVSENGTVLNHFVYDGFGTRTGITTAEFRYGYTGRELDTETGLYYYRARYYDSKVGRFISEDPIGFSAGDTNLYRYVGNNSTNYTDPSGQILANLGAGLLNVVVDAGLQLLTKGEIDDVGSLGVSFATGFIGYGLADKAGKLLSASRSVGQIATKYKYATSIATNAFADGGVGAVVQVGSNVVTGKNWSDNVWETATSQALFGGVSTTVRSGVGAAWNRNAGKTVIDPLLDEALLPLRTNYPHIDWNIHGSGISTDDVAQLATNISNNEIANELFGNISDTLGRNKYKLKVNLITNDNITMQGGGFINRLENIVGNKLALKVQKYVPFFNLSKIWGFNSYWPVLGVTISFDDDFTIRRIWLHGKDLISINIGSGYPGRLPFGLSFGINRNVVISTISNPNTSLEESEDMPNIKNYRAKWDIYYFCEGCIKFVYDYETERLDQLYIVNLPEDVEVTKQDLRSYLAINQQK